MLDGGCTLKLTGGCITDCHATGTGGGGVNSRDSGAILYMSGTARIENCTAKWSSANAIVNSGTMYADGGTVDGTINNQGKIKRSDAATDVTVLRKLCIIGHTAVSKLEYIRGQWRTWERSPAARSTARS